MEEEHTEAGVGVFGLDPLAPVLGEEHVRGEGAFRRVGVFLGLARRLFGLLCGFALEKGERRISVLLTETYPTADAQHEAGSVHRHPRIQPWALKSTQGAPKAYQVCTGDGGGSSAS
jgi:hypothetical protein